MTYSTEEDRFSVCSEVSSVQDLEDQPPNMLHTLLSEIYTQVSVIILTPLMSVLFCHFPVAYKLLALKII